jgi:hypothetical protein
MADGTAVVLGSQKGGLISVNGINLSGLLGRGDTETGRKIAAFIGVPFQEIRPPSVSEMMTTIGQSVSKAMGQTNQTTTPPNVKHMDANLPGGINSSPDPSNPVSPSMATTNMGSSTVQKQDEQTGKM